MGASINFRDLTAARQHSYIFSQNGPLSRILCDRHRRDTALKFIENPSRRKHFIWYQQKTNASKKG
jgi:hypothetical protein